MNPVYDHPSQKHLTRIEGAIACMAWHTGLDIQAVRKSSGREALYLAGQEVIHSHPEMAVVAYTNVSITHCRNQIKIHHGIDLT